MKFQPSRWPPVEAGRAYGRLTARREDPERVRGRNQKSAWTRVYWLCDCECGAKDVRIPSYNLRSGKTRSCGCLRAESIREVASAPHRKGRHGAHHLAGQVFGRLTARRRQGSKNGFAVWLCDCECGTKDHPVTSSALVRGATKSCGCIRREWGRLIGLEWGVLRRERDDDGRK